MVTKIITKEVPLGLGNEVRKLFAPIPLQAPSENNKEEVFCKEIVRLFMEANNQGKGLDILFTDEKNVLRIERAEACAVSGPDAVRIGLPCWASSRKASNLRPLPRNPNLERMVLPAHPVRRRSSLHHTAHHERGKGCTYVCTRSMNSSSRTSTSSRITECGSPAARQKEVGFTKDLP